MICRFGRIWHDLLIWSDLASSLRRNDPFKLWEQAKSAGICCPMTPLQVANLEEETARQCLEVVRAGQARSTHPGRGHRALKSTALKVAIRWCEMSWSPGNSFDSPLLEHAFKLFDYATAEDLD